MDNYKNMMYIPYALIILVDVIIIINPKLYFKLMSRQSNLDDKPTYFWVLMRVGAALSIIFLIYLFQYIQKM